MPQITSTSSPPSAVVLAIAFSTSVVGLVFFLSGLTTGVSLSVGLAFFLSGLTTGVSNPGGGLIGASLFSAGCRVSSSIGCAAGCAASAAALAGCSS